MNTSSTYYELLKVKPSVNAPELLAAYHAAKLAGSQLPTEEEKKSFHSVINQAYETLSDPVKRRQYDEILALSEAEHEHVESGPITGAQLAHTRVAKNLTLDDVFRVTRIPLKYLKAIEQDHWDELPARVYLQGFIKNLAHTYKIPPQETVQRYLEYFDSITQSPRV